ncbi:MAG: hypothetical protein PVI30_20230 [Myxococcales bacterium]|jgi:hypothetical protein
MGGRRRGLQVWLIAIACSVPSACEEGPDVVGAVDPAALSSARDGGVGSDTTTADSGAGCSPAELLAYAESAQIAQTCQVPIDGVASQVLIFLGELLGASAPTEEMRRATSCESPLQLLYADSLEDPQSYILCPSFCERLRERVAADDPAARCGMP